MINAHSTNILKFLRNGISIVHEIILVIILKMIMQIFHPIADVLNGNQIYFRKLIRKAISKISLKVLTNNHAIVDQDNHSRVWKVTQHHFSKIDKIIYHSLKALRKHKTKRGWSIIAKPAVDMLDDVFGPSSQPRHYNFSSHNSLVMLQHLIVNCFSSGFLYLSLMLTLSIKDTQHRNTNRTRDGHDRKNSLHPSRSTVAPKPSCPAVPITFAPVPFHSGLLPRFNEGITICQLAPASQWAGGAA